MGDEAVEPLELVVELGAGLRVAIRQVQAADDDAVDLGLDVAAVRVVGVAGQAAAALDGLAAFVARMATPLNDFWPCQMAW